MITGHEKVKLFLLTCEIAFGLIVLAIACHLATLMQITDDWFGYTLPALILIIVGLASVSFGIDTIWMREDVDGWDVWD